MAPAMRSAFAVALVLALAACSTPPVAPAGSDAWQVIDSVADSVVAADLGAADGDKATDAAVVLDAAAADQDAAVETAQAVSDTASSNADATADASDAAADAAVSVVVSLGEPGGTWQPQPGAGCVEPDAAAAAGCAGVVCPADKTCAGAGSCVPDSAFWVEPGALADQAWAAVATRDDGAYAAAWAVGNYFTGQQNVWLRVFAQGDEVGNPALQVSGGGPAAHLAPSVAALTDGTWLVLWRSDLQAKDEIKYFARKVLADGSAAPDPPFQVNITVLSSSGSMGASNIIAPLVVRLRNGRLLMAWSGAAKPGVSGTLGPLGIYARMFDQSGQPLGGELDTGALVGPSYSPAIAPLAGGQVLLAWEGPVAGGKGPRVVRGRAFGDQGQPLGPVLTLTPALQDYEALPAVATYESGQTLLTYKAGDNPNATSAVTVRGRLLGADLPTLPGVPVPAGLPHALDFDGQGTYPGGAAVASLSEQRAMAVWHNLDQPSQTIWGRRHYRSVDAWDCMASDLGGPKLPNEAGVRFLPGLATWPNGKWVLVFSALLTGIDEYRVAVRLGGW